MTASGAAALPSTFLHPAPVPAQNASNRSRAAVDDAARAERTLGILRHDRADRSFSGPSDP